MLSVCAGGESNIFVSLPIFEVHLKYVGIDFAMRGVDSGAIPLIDMMAYSDTPSAQKRG